MYILVKSKNQESEKTRKKKQELNMPSETEALLNCNDNDIPYYTLEGHQYICKCVRVYDGDTITVIFKPKGLSSLFKYNLRLNGIDAPEIKSIDDIEKELARRARDFVRDRILGKLIKIVCGKYDKYGRVLVEVFEMDSSKSLNQILIEQNHACAYNGGKKNGWTDRSNSTLPNEVPTTDSTEH